MAADEFNDVEAAELPRGKSEVLRSKSPDKRAKLARDRLLREDLMPFNMYGSAPLHVPVDEKEDGYSYLWANDSAPRIAELLRAGYDYADPKDHPTLPRSKELRGHGFDTISLGDMVLMRIEHSLERKILKANQAKIDATENILRGVTENRYTPTEGRRENLHQMQKFVRTNGAAGFA